MNEPTNRELKLMLDNSDGRNNDRHTEVMKLLLKIDDSMDDLRPRTQKLEYWRTAVVTAMTALIAFLAFMFPYVVRFIQAQIHTEVSVALGLDKYDQTIIDNK